jgi:ABC-type transporter Mla subunit MlaD
MLGIGIRNGMEVKEEITRLTVIVEQIGLAVLATTDTVEKLANRLDDLASHLETQSYHIQQQNYQIFALSETLQTLIDSQEASKKQTEQLLEVLTNFLIAINKNNDNL